MKKDKIKMKQRKGRRKKKIPKKKITKEYEKGKDKILKKIMMEENKKIMGRKG